MTGGVQTPWMHHCFAPFFFSFLGHLLGFISLEKQLQSNLYMTALHTMVTRQFPENIFAFFISSKVDLYIPVTL